MKDPMREENIEKNEPPGPMGGDDLKWLVRFMSGGRRAGMVRGPYNPTITHNLANHLLFLQHQLQGGRIPVGVAPLPDTHVNNFRRIYGFDIPSQVKLLDARKGEGNWDEADLVLGTPLHDLVVLATDDMPDDSFYVIHKQYVAHSETRLNHYVVMVPAIREWPDGWYILPNEENAKPGTAVVAVKVVDGYCEYFQEQAPFLETLNRNVKRVYMLSEQDAIVAREAIQMLINERDIEQIWKGQQDWNDTLPVLNRILNYSLSPNLGKESDKPQE